MGTSNIKPGENTTTEDVRGHISRFQSTAPQALSIRNVVATVTLALMLPLTTGVTSQVNAEVLGGTTGDKARRAMCQGERATIVGTNKGDRLFGTSGRDVIHAKGGHDVVFGVGGRDKICGGGGNDLLDGGGSRRDRLYGMNGRDYCSGEKREHRLHKGCEVHQPKVNVPRPPKPRATPRAVAPEPSAAEATSAAQQMIAGDQWFGYADPFCDSGAMNEIDYRSINITGAYTQPTSTVLVASLFQHWSAKEGRWLPTDTNQALANSWTVPFDNNAYSVPWYRMQLGDGAITDHWYVVFWMTPQGTWSEGRAYPINLYHNQAGASGVCHT